MFQTIKKEQTLELKKHVNAIHCTNNLTLVQRKLFNALLFNAYRELPTKSQFEIPARSLCNLIGYNSNDYGKLKQALMALMTVAIEWNVIDYDESKKSGKWRASSALSSAKLEDGICTYEYSVLMRELLHRPEIYGRIDMDVLSKFRSSYGLALYENCVRFQGLPHTPWFTYDVFRRLMGVFGNKYDAFKDFKKRVLTPAIEEVNEYSSITILVEIKRKNQKVIGLRFKLASNSKESTNTQIEDNELIEILTTSFGLSPETIKDLFEKYEFNYIKAKVLFITSSKSFRAGKIRGVAGYLIEALRKDYQPVHTPNSLLNQECKVIDFKQKETKKDEEIRRSYNDYLNSIINSYMLSLDSKCYENLLAQFQEHLKLSSSFIYDWFTKYGLEDPAVKASFNQFFKVNKREELKIIPTAEEFKASVYSKGETDAG